jgi:hypothetical protein
MTPPKQLAAATAEIDVRASAQAAVPQPGPLRSPQRSWSICPTCPGPGDLWLSTQGFSGAIKILVTKDLLSAARAHVGTIEVEIKPGRALSDAPGVRCDACVASVGGRAPKPPTFEFSAP